MKVTLGQVGNFNCILSFKDGYLQINELYENIEKMFVPDEIFTSKFDLKKMEIDEFTFTQSSSFDDDSIKKAIFETSYEKMILEFYKSQVVIEHLFKPGNIEFVKDGASSIINSLMKILDDYTLIVGYELSIYSNSFSKSLSDNLKDISMHPIIVIEKLGNKLESREYISDNSTITIEKLSLMNYYLKFFKENI
jgi:hypothetical protein